MTTPPGFDGERRGQRLAPAGAAAVSIGVCAGGWLAALLVPVGVALLLLACVSRRDGLLVLGPFARAELVMAARRGRPWLWRALYALAAAGLFAAVVREGFDRAGAPRRSLPQLAEIFFYLFAAIQLAYLGYLTAALVGPVVAEEREKRRWDMLLTTDLRNREILLGKAAGRAPQLLDPVLASLPILALLPFVGGVSPVLVGCAAAVTLATVLGVGGVAAFYSVFSPTAKKAAEQANGVMLGYYSVSGATIIAAAFPNAWTFPVSYGVPSPVEVRHVVGWVNAGNPVGSVILHATGISGSTDPLEDRLAEATRRHVAFHLGLFGLFGLAAVARLRAAKVTGGRVDPAAVKVWKKPVPSVNRPPVPDDSIAWWERYGTLTPGQLAAVAWFTPGRYVMVGVGLAVLFLAARALDQMNPLAWPQATDVPLVVVPMGVLMVGCILPVAAAVVAARSIAKERAADTLDGLKLTALSADEILGQKWRAVAGIDRPAYWLMACLAAAGLVTGFLHPVSLLVLALTPVYLRAAAGIGLWFSVKPATPAKAVRNLLLTVGGVGYLVSMLLVALPGDMGSFAALGVYPPAALGALVMPWVEGRRGGPGEVEVLRGGLAILAGAAAWAGLGAVAYRSAVRRFEADRAG